jgi:hypothetical protein
MTARNICSMVKMATTKLGRSTRFLASRFEISQTRVVQILKKDGIKYRKRKNAPKYDKDLEKRAKKACRILRDDFFSTSTTTSIVMDDESYFGLKCDDTAVNAGYYRPVGSGDDSVPNAIKFKSKSKSKYPIKLLVWVALSERGISDVYFLKRKASLNGDMYREECAENRLKPFLDEYHSDKDYYFWPDLACALPLCQCNTWSLG